MDIEHAEYKSKQVKSSKGCLEVVHEKLEDTENTRICSCTMMIQTGDFSRIYQARPSELG